MDSARSPAVSSEKPSRSAAKRTSIYDRLSDPSTFTGVYAQRFLDGPGINALSKGDTVHHMKDITRTYLNPGGSSDKASHRRRSSAVPPPPALGTGLSSKVVDKIDNNTKLQLIFQYYCKFGRTGASDQTLDNFNFAKLSRECPGLLDAYLNPTEIDLIFTKVKTKGQRRIEYSAFLDGLSMMAAVKYAGEDPAIAFSVLLEHHVFQCPAALGLTAARSPASASRPAASSPGGASAGTTTAAAPPVPPRRLPRSAPSADGVPLSYSARVLAQSRAESRSPAVAPVDRRDLEDKYTAESLEPSLEALHVAAMTHTPISKAFVDAAHGTVEAGLFSKPRSLHGHARKHSGDVKDLPGSPRVPAEYLKATATSSPSAASPTSDTASPRRGSSRSTRHRSTTAPPPAPRPTFAGEANRPGGVYDRLSSPATFTGVYKRAFHSDGRMNHYSTGQTAKASSFKGDTNTGTDEVIHDLKHLMRPSIKDGPTFR